MKNKIYFKVAEEDFLIPKKNRIFIFNEIKLNSSLKEKFEIFISINEMIIVITKQNENQESNLSNKHSNCEACAAISEKG